LRSDDVRLLILSCAMLAATPVVAAPRPSLPAPAVPGTLPPVLTDPRMADQLGRIAGALTRSLMDVRMGEVEAAIEGRPATRADRERTLRDQIGGAGAERRVEQQAAASGRAMQAVTRAVAGSLPAILSAIQGAAGEIDRATANLPSPTYPRR
jgi:hypothetical protein